MSKPVGPTPEELTPEEKRKEYALIRTYGITYAQYLQLLDKAGGVCQLCGKSPEENGQALAVDHNHKTGEIRGVLCRYCNHRVVGRHTDPDLLRRMAEYVENTTGWFVPAKKRKRKRSLPVKRTERKAVGKTARTKRSPS